MRTTLFRKLVLLTLPFLAFPLFSQEGDEELQLIDDKALSVHITARITEDGKETVWDMELTRVTISGRTVTVRLEGSNIIVVANFTPYQEDDDSVLLIAQGQTWISDGDQEENVQYRTSFESLPIDLGEPAIFLPLGATPLDVTLDTDPSGSFNIELEVTVEPYTGPAG